jgi:hypothetical protein
MRELLDLYGNFFIIHPDEDKITRNVITGDIRNFIKKENKIIDKYHSQKLVKSLGRLVTLKYLYLEKEIFISRIEHDYKYIKKLPYYKLIDELLREENETLGFLMKKYKETVREILIDWISEMDNELKNIVSVGRLKALADKPKNLNPNPFAVEPVKF